LSLVLSLLLIETQPCYQVEQHKRELEELKKSDPEFYEFLASSDKELLKFGADDEFDELDLEEDEEEDTAPQGGNVLRCFLLLFLLSYCKNQTKTTTMMTMTMTMTTTASLRQRMAKEF